MSKRQMVLGIFVGLVAAASTIAAVRLVRNQRPASLFTCQTTPAVATFTADSPGYVALNIQNNSGKPIVVNNAMISCPCIQADPAIKYPLAIPAHANRVLIFGVKSRADDPSSDVVLYVEADNNIYVQPITLIGRRVK